MPTLFQIIKHSRKKKQKKKREGLKGCPQKKGLVLKLFERTPRKPNSARRKIARVFFFHTKKMHLAYVPGERNNLLREHAVVLIRGGRTKDVPGMQYKLVRGPIDYYPDHARKRRRSRYGMQLVRENIVRMDKTTFTKRYRLKKK